jgi:hypothetical protein
LLFNFLLVEALLLRNGWLNTFWVLHSCPRVTILLFDLLFVEPVLIEVVGETSESGTLLSHSTLRILEVEPAIFENHA